MEVVKAIKISVIADAVLSPDVYYGDGITGIYFETEDEKFGRITFQNLDAIKICRGELMPYKYNYENNGSDIIWIYKIENSQWLAERFKYENQHYGSSYEFGGNVNEMLTDFGHYLFSFHDEVVEVIARGFWFEEAENNLFKQPLQAGHPFLNLPETESKLFETAGIRYKAIFNTTSLDQLVRDSQFCEQRLIEIAIEFAGKYSVSYTLMLMERQGQLISVLRPCFGHPDFEKEGVATFEDIKPFIDQEMMKISERRKEIRN